MTKIYLFLFLVISTFQIKAQDEKTLMAVFGRICQTDSIKNALLTFEEDSSAYFYFKTPDVETFGIMEYTFDDFTLVFDTGSNLLFGGKAYGSIDEMKFSKKKADIILRIEGKGDRAKEGKFETVHYSFVQKNYKWLLKGIKYNP